MQAIPYWIASLITGVVAVGYAQCFGMAEKITIAIFHFNAKLLFIISPLCFIFSWLLVRKYAPLARGSGIPQVMASIELANPKTNSKIKFLLSIRILIIKLLSSIILVIGGGAIGREGPTIQIAGSIFRKINELLPSWWIRISKKNMIMTGAAAGLAAAFNTPLGGIVFAVEELTKMHISFFRGAIFSAVIIAGLTAQSFLGPYLYVGYPDVTGLSQFILLDVALVAIISGILGSGMSSLIWYILKWKSKFKNYQQLIYLLCGSLLMASMAYYIDLRALGSGKSIITSTLFSTDKYTEGYIPVLRILGPIFSFTSGGAGGIFAPGLSAGASIGSTVSGWLELSSSNANLMILVGMVAFLTGITRAPFTSAILVLEMTDKNSLILHLLLAAIVANFASGLIDRHSIYYHLKRVYIDEAIEINDNRIGKE